MLSEDEIKAIERELHHYPERQGACIEALKIVQRRRGFVSDADLQDIAGFLQMSAAELDGVATFYNLIFRRPVGRHLILMCNSVSCWMLGFDAARAHLAQRLGIGFGETTSDGRFTLLTVPCLGACDRAPAMLIDDDLHEDLAPTRLDAILDRYP